MKKFTKIIVMAFLAGIVITSFSGCRTAHGFGEDMEHAGESIQRGTDR